MGREGKEMGRGQEGKGRKGSKGDGGTPHEIHE